MYVRFTIPICLAIGLLSCPSLTAQEVNRRVGEVDARAKARVQDQELEARNSKASTGTGQASTWGGRAAPRLSGFSPEARKPGSFTMQFGGKAATPLSSRSQEQQKQTLGVLSSTKKLDQDAWSRDLRRDTQRALPPTGQASAGALKPLRRNTAPALSAFSRMSSAPALRQRTDETSRLLHRGYTGQRRNPASQRRRTAPGSIVRNQQKYLLDGTPVSQ